MLKLTLVVRHGQPDELEKARFAVGRLDGVKDRLIHGGKVLARGLGHLSQESSLRERERILVAAEQLVRLDVVKRLEDHCGASLSNDPPRL